MHCFMYFPIAFSANGKDVIVDFPQQSHWTGLLSEMELVPSIHPGVTYVYSSGLFVFLFYSIVPGKYESCDFADLRWFSGFFNSLTQGKYSD